MKHNKDYYEHIKLTLHKLPRHICVKFALFCAKDSFQYVDDKDKNTVKKTLDLVELWLMDSTKVTNKDLYEAASAHSAHAAHSAYSAYSAAYAASAHAAHSAYSAAYAASAHAAYAAHSAHSASYAAHAAYSAHSTYYSAASNITKKYELYYNYLLSIITPLQKAIFLKEYNPN